jgi:hypothetical protein
MYKFINQVWDMFTLLCAIGMCVALIILFMVFVLAIICAPILIVMSPFLFMAFGG